MSRRMTAYALAAGLLIAASCEPRGAQPSPSPVADLDWPVPDFRLTERNGTTVTKADLLGKVWVASFVFTRCTGPCPAVTATVARLQEELKKQPDVRLVTFTVDPDRDTPDELKKYADRYGADPQRWLFLTGKEGEIHELATDGFKLLAAKKADPKPGDEFDHSTKLAVVDRRGVVRAVFDGMAATSGGESDAVRRSVGRLAAKVAELAKE